MSTEISGNAIELGFLDAEARLAAAQERVKKARRGSWLALYLNVVAIAISANLYWHLGRLAWGMVFTPLNIGCVFLLMWKLWKTR